MARFLLCALVLLPSMAVAAELRVAVAANFAPTLTKLLAVFMAESGHQVVVSSASTGKHYAQIRNGASFDVFLAADSERPALLEADGIGVRGSRFVYAEGQLALWLPRHPLDDDARASLVAAKPQRLSIANPRLAPYGLAARQVLEHWGLWGRPQTRVVRGENVAQAYQFVASGNAAAGLVALSYLRTGNVSTDSYVLINAALHEPIAQEALLLRDSVAARELLEFLRAEPARQVIRAAGYRVAGAG